MRIVISLTSAGKIPRTVFAPRFRGICRFTLSTPRPQVCYIMCSEDGRREPRP